MNYDNVSALVKALEAGGYNAAPSTLVQGSALQIEDLAPMLQNVTFQDDSIKLQKMLERTSCKSTLAQFDRQLSYGNFGGSAQLEGNVGNESTSDFARVTVPMCFYSHTRRVTLAATMVATLDGKKADERAASDAAKKIAGDIEFDLFRGRADFSNAGVFDGNPLAMPQVMANIIGLDVQIRQSDVQRNAQDLMFAEYGSDQSVVLPGGGTLTQDLVEDASVRSALNFGQADKLLVDPIVLSNYNKIVFGKERIILAGSPQDSTGGDLRRQFVSNGTVNVEASHFLRGKSSPRAPVANSPAAPVSVAPVSTTISGVSTVFNAGEKYVYFASAENEAGESVRCAEQTLTIVATGDAGVVTITHPASGVVRWLNVYRSAANGSVKGAKYIGRVALALGAGTTVFTDLGNKQPGFVTGFLVQGDTMEIKELAPYSRLKLAQTDLSLPEAHFTFCTLAVMQPRKSCLIDSLK
ncbi:hypothetical protein UFOVP75_86 [uncultured Caudovirales phage]|uniref:Major capsid protein n=1 Tax=uncultured Caudovirales phage TaxID=2100421 RepID=A0A6J5KXQ1_9CAUD|nr:hypothetical protein UFOVP75_86 [uncultured Caudovirales phage]